LKSFAAKALNPEADGQPRVPPIMEMILPAWNQKPGVDRSAPGCSSFHNLWTAIDEYTNRCDKGDHTSKR
jgi:hypothetical protein